MRDLMKMLVLGAWLLAGGGALAGDGAIPTAGEQDPAVVEAARPLATPNARAATGDPAASDWTVQDMDGKRLSFDALTQGPDGEKRPLFLYFWATWCRPCKIEMPFIARLEEQYGDEMTFLYVAEEPVEVVREFAKDGEPGVTMYTVPEQAPASFEILVYPTSIIRGCDGEDARHVGVNDWTADGAHDPITRAIASCAD